jgi:small subunit ribosomal protein S21
MGLFAREKPWGRMACRRPSASNPKGPVQLEDKAPQGPVEGVRKIVQVLVRDNNVDQALRALKKKMQREGIFREMKLRRNYEKPSEKKAREKAEAVRRVRKLLRKRLDREGY